MHNDKSEAHLTDQLQTQIKVVFVLLHTEIFLKKFS